MKFYQLRHLVSAQYQHPDFRLLDDKHKKCIEITACFHDRSYILMFSWNNCSTLGNKAGYKNGIFATQTQSQSGSTMNVKSKSKHRNYVAPAQCVKSPPYLLGNTCLRRRSYGFARIIHKPGCTFKSFRPAQGKIFYLLFGPESDHCIATNLLNLVNAS